MGGRALVCVCVGGGALGLDLVSTNRQAGACGEYCFALILFAPTDRQALVLVLVGGERFAWILCAPTNKMRPLSNVTPPSQVDALQQQYIRALTALYDRHKVQYGGRRPDAVLDVQ